MFPSNDPRTWNGGVWPPVAMIARWKELYLAALAGSAARILVEGEETTCERDLVRVAANIADWGLRTELEACGVLREPGQFRGVP